MNSALLPIYLDPVAPTDDQLPHRLEDIHRILDQYGVVVLKNFFPPDQAEQWKQEIINWLISISDGLTHDPKTWRDPKNLPHGPRLGMMQSLLTNCPTVWTIRQRLYPLFSALHGTDRLLTSQGGGTVFPPTHDPTEEDWPHIDQTVEDLYCVQSQVVLSETTASFRCTPTSHLDHTELLNLAHKTGCTTNWHRFRNNQIKKLKPKYGDFWQTPIHSPPGSVILWRSNTIHSAQKNEPTDLTGWRCTIYVCMRPEQEFSKNEKQALTRCFLEGRSTNHWGTTIFDKRQGRKFKERKNPRLENFTENPHLLAIKDPNRLIRRLVGLESYDQTVDDSQ